MANRFWVGGGSANTWAATASTNWATTSGGANNASVPTTTDVAIFDGGSGVGNSVIGANITVQGLDCAGGTGTYAGTITHNSGVTLTINTGAASSLRLTSGMTFTAAAASSIVAFTNTTGTAQITSAGKNIGSITVNGVGGTVQQQDDLLISAFPTSVLTVTNGIFDGNAHALTLSQLSSNNSNTRSLILGSGLTMTGTAQSWVTAGSNLTFTKNSANVTINNPGANGPVVFTSSLTWNGITLNASTNAPTFRLAAGNTFSSFTVGSGWTIEPTGTTTVSSAFTWTGTAANPISVISFSDTTQAVFSVASGACALTWGALYNITGSGGATFTATNSLAFGTTTGWAFNVPQDGTTSGLVSSIWRDTTSGDFTVASSIGKSLFTSGNAPGAASGLALVGSAVNATQIAGSATAATNLSKSASAIGRGTVTTGSSTTSVTTSALSLSGSAATGVVADQFKGCTVYFDGDTATAGLRDAQATISASSASNTPTLTVGTLPATPVSGDTFSIG